MAKRLLLPLLLIARVLVAQEPEACMSGSAVTIEYGGKKYALADEACRDQFLTDPERYSQLYDALLELQASGKKIEAAPPSLVPG